MSQQAGLRKVLADMGQADGGLPQSTRHQQRARRDPSPVMVGPSAAK